MGMGYAGCSLVTIDESVIKRKCPKLLSAFRDVVSQYGEYDVFSVTDGQSNLNDDDTEKVHKAHSKLVDSFYKKTGLCISYFYHDTDNDGDRYDDIGEAWMVSNAYELTDSAKPFEKSINTVYFVQFG